MIVGWCWTRVIGALYTLVGCCNPLTRGFRIKILKITWVMRRLQWYNTQIFQHCLIQVRHLQTFWDWRMSSGQFLFSDSDIVDTFMYIPPPNRTLLWWVIIPTFCCLKSSRSHCVIADDAWICPKCWCWNIVSAPVVQGMTRVWDQNNPPCGRHTQTVYMTLVLMMPITRLTLFSVI